ncbi:MAG: fatty acid desaturase [Pseudomonadota bacterium]|nr:fatty acid desaturase [Pseudomonadota bacterium]
MATSRRPERGGRWLRHRADRRSLGVVALALWLLAVPYLWQPTGIGALAWIGGSSAMCFLASLVAHNHMHCTTFRSAVLNRLLEIVLSLARGHTASGIVVPHHLNHHPLAARADDWIGPALAGSGVGWRRLVRYVLRASLNMLWQRRRPGAPKISLRRKSRARHEQICLGAVIALLLLLDWRTFALFTVLPWLAGLAALVGVNLLQHDATEPELRLGESRNFTGTLGNWLCLNNGFHTAHHQAPGLHWSLLAQQHMALRDALPRRDLEQRSILGFLWRFAWSRTADSAAPQTPR